MQITVHRGLDQIGGCITEISTATSRVFIDMGQNLPGVGEPTTPVEDQKMVENIFARNLKEHQAVFYTHTHEDHIGLFWAVPDDVPQYLGEASKGILDQKHKLIKKALQLKKEKLDKNSPLYSVINEKIQHEVKLIDKIIKMRIWQRPKSARSPKPMRVGDISITPYYCSHSSLESYMFLIEVEGKRIWHTGDFRGHGYLGHALFKTLETYARDIDTLIIEGTMLGREEACITEKEVSKKMEQVMRAFKNVFVLISATDIERLVSIKNAAYEANRPQYLDMSSWYIFWTIVIGTHVIGKNYDWLHFPDIDFVDMSRSLPKDGFVIPVNLTMMGKVRSVLDQLNPAETLLIYSTWDGYYKDPEQVAINPRYKAFREMFDNVVNIHTSGHASQETLAQVITTINPKESIIGIHKDPDTSLKSLDIPIELKAKVKE